MQMPSLENWGQWGNGLTIFCGMQFLPMQCPNSHTYIDKHTHIILLLSMYSYATI